MLCLLGAPLSGIFRVIYIVQKEVAGPIRQSTGGSEQMRGKGKGSSFALVTTGARIYGEWATLQDWFFLRSQDANFSSMLFDFLKSDALLKREID